jgi:N6-adenosine-specific RNA methylase IME4
MTRSPPADNLPLPPPPEGAGTFKVISLDLPWHFESRAPSANPTSVRSPQKHYPTMDLAHCEKVPVREFADKSGCFVFLWITGPLMVKGVHNRLFRAWGVRPSSTAFVWVKTKKSFPGSVDVEPSTLFESDLHLSLGLTTRQNAEFVMLGRIGSPSRARADIRQIIFAPVAEHSRKPDEFFRRARHYAQGPYLDMFAGGERKDWTSYGWSHRNGERSEMAVTR